MKNIIGIATLLFMIICMGSCKEDEVIFSSTDYYFNSLQIQKFDYGQRIGVGKIYQGKYSVNKDTVYFDVTYFPDETAPTYQDWQMQASVYNGAIITPGVGGIKDLKDPLHLTVTAPDGSTSTQVVVVTKIYEVPYGELDYGFGRYNKLWEKTGAEMTGFVTDNQTAIAIVGDELILNNRISAMLVYDKKTGIKKANTVPVPPGNTDIFFAIATDNKEVLHSVSYIDANNKTSKCRIYRWSNGINSVPEVFMEINATDIPTTKATGMGRSISICGDTHGDAQIMIALDGSGTSENRIVRISVIGGVPSPSLDIFAVNNISWTWRGKGVATSPNGKSPYFASSLGSPAGLTYNDNTGTYQFETNAANSNFLNMTAVTGAYYFKFNNARYLVASSTSWPGVLRMLIFNVDDTSIIPTNKNNNMDAYNILNPFREDFVTMRTSNGNGTGDVTVQVQPDGKTALVYMLDTNTGVMCYELTNVGAAN